MGAANNLLAQDGLYLWLAAAELEDGASFTSLNNDGT